MKYASYKHKIELLNSFLNKVYQLRIFLIALVSTITVSTVSFGFAKGKVSINEDVSSFVYGDSVNFSSSAFLMDSYVEYSLKGSDTWFSEAPSKAGDYYVRGVSKNGYGATTTSKPFEFSITKRPASVYVNQAQITYGDIPNISANLFGGDYIGDQYSLLYDDPYANLTDVKPNLESITIFNRNGEDVTDCYDLKVSNRPIRILPRKLVISFPDESKIYDGVPLSAHDGVISEETPLVEGDTLTFGDSSKEIPNDVYSNLDYYKPVNIFRDNHNINNLYDIEYLNGNLSVNPIEMTIKSPGYNDVYNGKTLSENGVFGDPQIICDRLMDNHYVKIDYDNYENLKNSYITDEGGFENSFSAIVCKKVGQSEVDVTNLYSIKTIFNNVNVRKFDLDISTKSVSKTFDGEGLSNTTYELDKDLPGSDFVEINTDSLPVLSYETTSTTVVNTFLSDDYISIKNSKGLDVTNCYNISLTPGNLCINKRPLLVEMKNYEGEYDAEEHCIDNFVADPNKEDDLISGNNPIFSVSLKNAKRYAKYVGDDYLSTGKENILVKMGDIDVSEFFDITCENVTSIIKPRKIHPTLCIDNNPDLTSATYDGKEKQIYVQFKQGDIPEEDTPVFGNNSVFTSRKLYKENGYTLNDLEFDIRSGEQSVLNQYEIVDENCIMIEKALLQLELPKIDVAYDGDEHVVSYKTNVLETGDTVSSNFSATLKNAGDEFEFKKEYIDVENADCYVITIKDDLDSTTSTIRKKEITVNLSNYKGEYDGKYHDINVSCDLPEGFSLKENKFSIKNAKKYTKDDFAISILKNGAEDVTENFDISYNSFDIEIEKFSFTANFCLPATTPVYNGEYYNFDNCIITREDEFPEGEKPVVKNVYKECDAGTYLWDNVDMTIDVVYSANESISIENWEDNYDLKINHWEKAMIEKKKLYLTYNDFNPVFNNYTVFEEYSYQFEEANNSKNNYLISVSDGFSDVTNQYLNSLGTHLEISPVEGTEDINFVKTDSKISDYIEVKLSNPNNTNVEDNFDISIDDSKQFHTSPYSINLKTKISNQTYVGASNLTALKGSIAMSSAALTSTTFLYVEHDENNRNDKNFFDNFSFTASPVAGSFYEFIDPNSPSYLVGTYDINIDTSKFSLKSNADNSILSSDYYVFNGADKDSKILNVEDALKIVQREITISEVSDIKKTDGTQAKEQFSISGLQKNDVLYLYNLKTDEKEEVSSSKTSYDMIYDILDSITGRNSNYHLSFIDLENESSPIIINENSFKIYRDVDGNLVDVTYCYKIKYNKSNGVIRF